MWILQHLHMGSSIILVSNSNVSVTCLHIWGSLDYNILVLLFLRESFINIWLTSQGWGNSSENACVPCRLWRSSRFCVWLLYTGSIARSWFSEEKHNKQIHIFQERLRKDNLGWRLPFLVAKWVEMLYLFVSWVWMEKKAHISALRHGLEWSWGRQLFDKGHKNRFSHGLAGTSHGRGLLLTKMSQWEVLPLAIQENHVLPPPLPCLWLLTK